MPNNSWFYFNLDSPERKKLKFFVCVFMCVLVCLVCVVCVWERESVWGCVWSVWRFLCFQVWKSTIQKQNILKEMGNVCVVCVWDRERERVCENVCVRVCVWRFLCFKVWKSTIQKQNIFKEMWKTERENSVDIFFVVVRIRPASHTIFLHTILR